MFEKLASSCRIHAVLFFVLLLGVLPHKGEMAETNFSDFWNTYRSSWNDSKKESAVKEAQILRENFNVTYDGYGEDGRPFCYSDSAQPPDGWPVDATTGLPDEFVTVSSDGSFAIPDGTQCKPFAFLGANVWFALPSARLACYDVGGMVAHVQMSFLYFLCA